MKFQIFGKQRAAVKKLLQLATALADMDAKPKAKSSKRAKIKFFDPASVPLTDAYSQITARASLLLAKVP